MVFAILFSPTFPPISSTRSTQQLTCLHGHLPSTSLQWRNNQRGFPPPSVASIPYQPINVDYLEREFSGHGVTFEDISDSCVAKLVLDNGSSATLMLPSGLITSYKVPLWHGDKMELLHTSVSEGEDGGAVIEGGVSLAFNFVESYGERSWSPTTWVLHDITGNSRDSIQVELINTDADKMVEMKQVMSLREDILSSELLISNTSSSAVQLSGSILTHLTVSTPEATYAVGLEGSNFINKPPFLSKFGMIPPEESNLGFGQLWDDMIRKGLFSGGSASAKKKVDAPEEETEQEEYGDYKHLQDEMSRIYTCAPQSFTVIDRGRRNSVIVGRDGFEELYMFSPGSSYEFYGEYAYVCLGQAALLKPITLRPGDAWRGGQHLHNPNL